MIESTNVQSWPRPSNPRPIVIVGAGGIVRAAHLPAYRRLGFDVAGLFDRDRAAARATSELFDGVAVLRSWGDVAARTDAVFDVAVPGDQVVRVLRKLPDGVPVLIQKPLGRDLAEARRILALCRDKGLIAAMNFQLRFAPGALALAAVVARGGLGRLADVEVRINTHTPWSNWAFMASIPRLEILYHSIHYLDYLRLILGEPGGVHATALTDPRFAGYPDTHSALQLRYDDGLLVRVSTNHHHAHGRRHAASELRVEGSEGAAVLKMGVNLDYPKGEPDTLEFASGEDWRTVPLRGSWFTEAFEGPMSNLQRFAAGEDASLVSPVEDAARTMALVEACYRSAARAATPIPQLGATEEGRR